MIKIVISFLFLFSFSFAGELEKAKVSTFEKILNEITLDSNNIDLPNPQYEKSEIKIENELKNDPRLYVKISAKDKYQRTKLLELGLDILEVKDSFVTGFINKNDLNKISEKDYTVMEKKSIYDHARQYEKDFPSADSAYHNYNETYNYLKEIQSKNSDITSLFSIGKTIEGRDIWCLRINSNAKDAQKSSKPGAVFVGNHHAREHLSNEVPLLFAAYLMDNRNNSEIKKYIDGLDIYIIPMFNPDGVEYDIATGSYRWHRKNTRVNSDKSIGVDLNRNYDTTWCKYGSSNSPSADTYCGTKPFSEPETQAMRDFILARKNIKTLQSYHSYASLILYPWGGLYDPISDEKDRNAFIKMANEMAKLTGYTAQQSSDLYAASGDACDWAYEKAKIFAFTTELEGSSFYPGAAIIKNTVEKNIKAALYLLSMTDNPYK
jgi:carboxypeptidase T